MSNENVKQTIDVFFKHIIIIPSSQITATPAFPKEYIPVRFVFKANKDYKNETLSLSMTDG